MTKENKELLLKDLCGRLPYGVALEQTYKVTVIATNTEEVLTRIIYLYSINSLDDMTVSGIHNDGDIEICFFEEIKPFLFPMSSMTEEQKKEYRKACELDTEILSKHPMDGTPFPVLYNSQDWLNKNNFDYRGLIEKGLAYDKDTKMATIQVKNHFDMNGLIPMGLAIDCTNLNIY